MLNTTVLRQYCKNWFDYLEHSKNFWELPGIKGAVVVTVGSFLPNIINQNLTTSIIMIILITLYIIFAKGKTLLNYHNSLLYILLLTLSICGSMIIYQEKIEIANTVRMEIGEEIQVSSVFRRRLREGNPNVTLLVRGSMIEIPGKNRRIDQSLIIRSLQKVPEISYGEKLKISGKVERLNEKYKTIALSDSHILGRDNTFYNVFCNKIFTLKKEIKMRINQNIKKPGNDLAAAMLLGERWRLNDKVKTSFRKAGVSHVLAVSGLHLGLILAFFIMLFNILRCPKWLNQYTLALIVIIYLHMTNFQASIVRASTMALIIIIAKILYRPVNLLNILGAAVFVIGIIQPDALSSVSMQLSIAATFFIIAVIVPLEKIIFEQYYFPGWQKRVIELIMVTFSAWLGVIPLVIYYFRELNLVGLISSVIIVPLTASLLFTGISLLFVSGVSHYFALLLGKLFFWISHFTLKVVDIFSDWHFARWPVQSISLIFIVGYYVLAVIIFGWLAEAASQVKELKIPVVR